MSNGLLLISILLFSLFPFDSTKGETKIFPPQDAAQQDEIFLSFSYQNLFDRIIIAQQEGDQYYLPVSELFSALNIPHEVSVTPPTITGSYLAADNTFQIHFQENTVSLDSKGEFTFEGTEMRIGETDFYMTPEIFNEVFELEFNIDFNNLVLTLDTPHELPIVAEYRRSQERNQERQFSLRENPYELRFDRNRKMVYGGFLDYSLTANVTSDNNSYSLNTTLGGELLGGDIQGQAFTDFRGDNSSFLTNNVRWRYAWREKDYLSKIVVGQTRSDGLENRRFRGLSITNEPVEPRYMFEEFEIQGDAPPGSEVELYINESLYSFQEIDQNGQYRFLAPVTYGSSRLRLQIFNPAGGVREISRRIQVPFNYLPEGEFEYHLNAGRMDNTILGSSQLSNIVQGDISYGISNKLTQEIGFEYLNEFSNQTPLFYSSTSARIFTDHLLNLEIAPTAFYRVSANALYASSASWNLNYTNFRNRGIYNNLNSDHNLNGNVYLPFTLVDFPSGFRLSGSHTIQNSTSRTRYNIDFNTRIRRLNLRLRFSDSQTNRLTLKPSASSELRSFATYSFGRNQSINPIFRGTFLRGGLSFNPATSSVTRLETQIAKSVFNNGRIQAGFSRNVISDTNFFTLSFSLDLNNSRLSTRANTSSAGGAVTQNVSGSIGYDNNANQFVFSNRRQVGRAATSIRLYVDNNNSGSYDSGDDIIRNNAIRVNQSSTSNMKEDGTIYLSQLQPYNQVNLEINKSAIQNPLLIPEFEQFSIVTDPNQYKPINIPFYVSGVISGRVQEKRNGNLEPLSGMRVHLTNEEESFQKEMRTFSDGSFYAYEIPPGTYKLSLDENQLTFLDAVSQPDTIDIEVEPTEGGDFIEELNFTVVPRTDSNSDNK